MKNNKNTDGMSPLERYYRMLYPDMLQEDEYVRILTIFKPDYLDKPIVKSHLVKNYQEFQKFVSDNRQKYNLYTTIATVKANGTKESLRKRKVLFLDFDKKDYSNITKVEEFADLIKSKINIFYQCVLDSGNGYHFYFSIEPSCKNREITTINRLLAELVGADTKATLETQLVRIPTSINMKDKDNRQPVSIIRNSFGDSNCKPYKLEYIASRIAFTQRNLAIEDMQQLDKKEITGTKKYYCIESMIANGSNKGERNFCLGRITKYLQLQGYKEAKALKEVLEWNLRCTPPKSENEVKDDFNNYWNTDYKLLGCKLENQKYQDILDKYCDRYMCDSILHGELADPIRNGDGVLLNNKVLKDKVMRELSGNDFLILTVLERYKNSVGKRGFTLARLKNYLTGRRSGCCISVPTLRTCLERLEKKKYIEMVFPEDDKTFSNKIIIKPINLGFHCGYTSFYYSAAILRINNIITAMEYKVYLHLIKSLAEHKSVSYDDIADRLDIDRGNVAKYILGLHKAQAIEIEKVYSEKGHEVNRYKFINDINLINEYNNFVLDVKIVA